MPTPSTADLRETARPGAQAALAAHPSGQPGHLLVFTDSTSNKQFLVDRASAYSIVLHSSSEPASGPAIMATDRTPIPCWGGHVQTITDGRHTFKWTFLHAAVAFPILGVDFLWHFDLAVDIKNMKLTRNGHPYVQLSAPQSCGHIGEVADISTPSPAGAAQQPQAASLCAWPPASDICQQPAGVAQQSQAASLCAGLTTGGCSSVATCLYRAAQVEGGGS